MNPKNERAILIASFFLFLVSSSAEAQTANFFSNTQSQGSVSSGSCPTCPGFNPAELVKHASPSPVIDGAPVAGVAPFFNGLGPGAITDNMFGILSRDDPGPDALLGTADDRPVARCGVTVGTFTNGLPGLNCGSIRFDPASQGMTLSTGGNMLSGSSVSPLSVDFDPNLDSHVGFNLVNTLSLSCPTGGGGPPAPPDCAGATQEMKQVTTILSGLGGTFSLPGGGDQVHHLTFSWANSGNNCASVPCSFTNPAVSWMESLIDPSPDGSGEIFTINAACLSPGCAFLYNSGSFPTVVYPPGATPTTSDTVP